MEKRTPTIDCLTYIHKGGIVDRIDSRRTSFLSKNADSPLIRQGETSVYSSGEESESEDRNTHSSGWKTSLKTHIFFSDIDQTIEQTHDDRSLSRLMHPEAFNEVD